MATKLSISLTLPEKVRTGTAVAASLVVANEGSSAITVVHPDYHAALNLVVFDRTWDQVSPDSVGKVHVAYSQLNLAPGESRTFDLDDLVFTTGTARMRFTLGRGTYYVAAIYHPGSARLPLESSYPLVAISAIRELIVE
jgi:hypothetical protein